MGTNYLQINNLHLFIWLGLIFLLSHITETQRQEIVLQKPVWRSTPFYAVLVFLPVLLMTVWGRPRSDTYLYLSIYRTLPSSFSAGWDAIVKGDNPGFTLFGILIKQIFGANDTAYRLAIALVHTIPLIVIIRRYSEDYWFSMYVFVAAGNHLAWMMNGMRQFMAATIIFAATPWIIQKKYIKTIVVILIAASFHRTALFMLPVIFIVQGEVWNWKTILFSIVIVFATFIFSRNSALFDDFADNVGYSLEAARDFGDDGVNPLRVLVSAVPMVLAFMARGKLREENNGVINICVNMSIITVGINLIAMVTSGIMVGRMPIYTSLYNLILLPHVIKTYFEEHLYGFIVFMAVILYFLQFVVQWSLFV